jgi:hypothetical protein
MSSAPLKDEGAINCCQSFLAVFFALTLGKAAFVSTAYHRCGQTNSAGGDYNDGRTGLFASRLVGRKQLTQEPSTGYLPVAFNRNWGDL